MSALIAATAADNNDDDDELCGKNRARGLGSGDDGIFILQLGREANRYGGMADDRRAT